jgi:hypothetical protein
MNTHRSSTSSSWPSPAPPPSLTGAATTGQSPNSPTYQPRARPTARSRRSSCGLYPGSTSGSVHHRSSRQESVKFLRSLHAVHHDDDCPQADRQNGDVDGKFWKVRIRVSLTRCQYCKTLYVRNLRIFVIN